MRHVHSYWHFPQLRLKAALLSFLRLFLVLCVLFQTSFCSLERFDDVVILIVSMKSFTLKLFLIEIKCSFLCSAERMSNNVKQNNYVGKRACDKGLPGPPLFWGALAQYLSPTDQKRLYKIHQRNGGGG